MMWHYYFYPLRGCIAEVDNSYPSFPPTDFAAAWNEREERRESYESKEEQKVAPV